MLVLCPFLALATALPSLATAHTAYVSGINGGGIVISRTTAAPDDEGAYVMPVDLDAKTTAPEIMLDGYNSPWGLAITPDGTRVYVADTGADQVVPVDTATNKAGTPIPVGEFPTGTAITPDGTRAYVTNFFEDTVTPIDLSSNTPEPSISMGDGPNDIAITPDGTRAYVVNAEDDTVERIDLATNTVVKTIPVGDGPHGVAVTPDGTRVYVANINGETVSRIDTATDTVGETIAAIPAAEVISISPDGEQAYVLGWNSDVLEIDLTTDLPGASIPWFDNYLYGVAMRADGSRAYITDNSDEELVEVDTTTNSPTDSFAIGDSPEAIAIVPNQGPEASFSVTPTNAEPKDVIEFDAGASSDSDGSVARYDWDFGDGETEEDGVANPTHTYEADGYYDVTLTVTDNEGCSTTMVFTGQTAYCNGSMAARATEMVDIDTAPPEKPKEEPKKEPETPKEVPKTPATVDSGTPAAEFQRAPEGEVKAKRKAKKRCPRVTAKAMTFVPKLVPGHVVPGVRVRMEANRPADLKVRAILVWAKDGVRHETSLGGRSARIDGWIRVRFPIPARLRSTLPYRRKVKVKLKIQTLPRANSSSCRKVSERMVEVRITKVFPGAVQRGS